MSLLTPQENEQITKEVICETRRQFEKAGWKVPRIAKELALIGFSDIQDYVIVDEGGALQVLPLDTLKKNKSRAIKKVREKTIITESKDGEKIYKTSIVEFELHDKMDSLRLGVEIIGIKKPKEIKLSGTVNLADVLNAARERANAKPSD
jgi:hypothetical protein